MSGAQVFGLVCVAGTLVADEAVELELETRFAGTVLPFLEGHCFDCHGTEKKKGKLDLSPYTTTEAIALDHRLWKTVLERLEAGEMPPEEAKKQPAPEQRQDVAAWIRAFRQHEANKHAGDPGIVLARRMSNAEYDYTIRDLTGVDIRPAREFPVDPANEAGFDNSGESLTMSPALLNKYLAAARLVADHLVLTPEGFLFAPHPATTDSDRDKFCVKRIVDFYGRHQIDYADYFLAAWRFRYRQSLGNAGATLTDVAKAGGISSKYLATLWNVLEETTDSVGPIAKLKEMWNALPVPDADASDRSATVRDGCEAMRDFIIGVRRKLEPQFGNLSVRGISSGSQPLVLWTNRQFAEHRMRYTGDTDDERERAALENFCGIFPDAFLLSERGRMFLDPAKRNRGRLLNAGFHLMTGYFRDDRPLYELVLDDERRRKIDRLWQELNFVTSAPMRQYKDFVFFERAEPPRFMWGEEFDFARSEDKDVTSQAKIDRLAERYIARAREHDAKGETLEAIEFFFREISAEIRWVEETRPTAEPGHLKALLAFAERAYRRPLTPTERGDFQTFYQSLRDDGLGHEDAIRDSVASVLMSPHFSYRVNLAAKGDGAIRPLSDHSLASRLSYFLWSSMPDGELLSHAAAGDLNRPEVLAAQAGRMLKDNRIRGLATEFGGNWLAFRRFEEHNSVDRERFKDFTDDLRRAMFDEPIRFFVDLVQTDRSVLDFLYADHTFVNPVLARHYGMPISSQEEWERVDDATAYDRGGLLPMSVFLTMNAPGRRTSPVKRGYWVVHRLLGEHIPAPPPNVPELPDDEAKTGDLTLPQLLARHRDNPSCAGCHDRFDSIGLAFEGFGPVGERRSEDLGGRPVQTQATFPDGTGEGDGLNGLRAYLRAHREAEFIDNLCRKLLSYALGRGLLLSDEPMIEEMRTSLAKNDYRFASLIEMIVTSRQFLTVREN
jgi:hypothetical protein